ncbi:MAG: HAD family hydrolase [Bacteroidales bacterium]|nr:HAD family hydrolase [Bacteroidales bacterium]
MSALFLDRDGVLNVLRPNDYVKSPDELVMLPGVKEALDICRRRFSHLFIVTNQQGIGKGLMTEADLEAIHRKLLEAVGPVDRIYHCPDLERSHSFRRKPNIGMALQARRDYPDIRLKDSVMVGDSKTDILFGRRAGMTTVLVGCNSTVATDAPHLVDYRFPTLLDFAQNLPKGLQNTNFA